MHELEDTFAALAVPGGRSARHHLRSLPRYVGEFDGRGCPEILIRPTRMIARPMCRDDANLSGGAAKIEAAPPQCVEVAREQQFERETPLRSFKRVRRFLTNP